MEKKTFRLATLGCRTNQYETQAFRDQLLAIGYREAQEGEIADLCIVNTCTVTNAADQSSRHQIRKLVQHTTAGGVVVTGCMAERRPDWVHQISEEIQVVPNAAKARLVADLFPDQEIPEFSICNFEAHTRAFVKVQDGCNSFCTYCIIPYVRGRSKSRTVQEVVCEVEQLVESGYQEIVITGINVGDFVDENKRLVDLVRAVDEVKGIARVRISSIDPDEVDEELMEAVIKGKHTCQSLHLVLQSGSNVVLKRMNRKYTRQIFLETVEKLKKASPDFTFTTDVLVGFPGETEIDFQETLDVIREVQFAKVHMFPFSPRERTRAALYPHQITREIMEERKNAVLRLAEEVAYSLRNQYVGRTMTILTEGHEGEWITGHTDNFLRVKVPASNLVSNQLINAFLSTNTPDGLVVV
jgi:threonylcarbamoyladenosine tRNA methylthiotransferase MtaB